MSGAARQGHGKQRVRIHFDEKLHISAILENHHDGPYPTKRIFLALFHGKQYINGTTARREPILHLRQVFFTDPADEMVEDDTCQE